MIIVSTNAAETENTDDFQVINGKMRFDVQVELLRENGGGSIQVKVMDGGEACVVVSADTGIKPVLQLRKIKH